MKHSISLFSAILLFAALAFSCRNTFKMKGGTIDSKGPHFIQKAWDYQQVPVRKFSEAVYLCEICYTDTLIDGERISWFTPCRSETFAKVMMIVFLDNNRIIFKSPSLRKLDSYSPLRHTVTLDGLNKSPQMKDLKLFEYYIRDDLASKTGTKVPNTFRGYYQLAEGTTDLLDVELEIGNAKNKLARAKSFYLRLRLLPGDRIKLESVSTQKKQATYSKTPDFIEVTQAFGTDMIFHAVRPDEKDKIRFRVKGERTAATLNSIEIDPVLKVRRYHFSDSTMVGSLFEFVERIDSSKHIVTW